VLNGGGQAGLAMSRCLADRNIDHVVLERGDVAERWRSERWESLRLLTPNWMSRLPGFAYDGADPDGYMTMGEVVRYFERYAAAFDAPVERRTAVLAVSRRPDGGYLVRTTAGTWHAPAVVIATGHSDRPRVPAFARALSPDVMQITATSYRRPDDLPAGGVLVVGASASGVQIADELQAAGRQVTLAVGRHIRLPRTYRGRDILWWLDRMGLLNQRIGDVRDRRVSMRQPSFQLVGRPDRATLGVAELRARGVRLVGRVLGAADGTRVTAGSPAAACSTRLHLDDDLMATTAAADAKLATLVERIERWTREHRNDPDIDAVLRGASAGPQPPFDLTWPACVAPTPRTLDLAAEGIGAVVWATGFRRDYSWLNVPVVDDRGDLVHDGGITAVPGLVAIGLAFQRRRNSAFIDGVGADAEEIAAHLAALLHRQSRAA
jgi:putative flavoprotein involved in K+ transport